MLMPLKAVLSCSYEYRDGKKTRQKAYVMFVPAAMLTVDTELPEVPPTLQVRSVEVTSVTGLLLGGIRI